MQWLLEYEYSRAVAGPHPGRIWIRSRRGSRRCQHLPDGCSHDFPRVSANTEGNWLPFPSNWPHPAIWVPCSLQSGLQRLVCHICGNKTNIMHTTAVSCFKEPQTIKQATSLSVMTSEGKYLFFLLSWELSSNSSVHYITYFHDLNNVWLIEWVTSR